MLNNINMQEENAFFSCRYEKNYENNRLDLTVLSKENGKIFESEVNNFFFNSVDGSTLAIQLGNTLKIINRDFECITSFDSGGGEIHPWWFVVSREGLLFKVEGNYYLNKNFKTILLVEREEGFLNRAIPSYMKSYIGIYRTNSEDEIVMFYFFDSDGNPINMSWKMYFKDLEFTRDFLIEKYGRVLIFLLRRFGLIH